MKATMIWKYGVAVLLLGFFLVVLGGPLLVVVRTGMDPAMWLEIFRHPVYREGLWNALAVALGTTALTAAIALPMALLYDRFDFPGKWLSNLAVLLPMILPPFVGALGFQQLLGHYGVVNAVLAHLGLEPVNWLGGEGRYFAVCLVEALHLFPILYLNLLTALANIDPALDDAARNLGSGWRERFFRIKLPLLLPGLFAGGSLVLIWSFTELGTPLMLGFTRITPVQVFNGLTELESNPLPFALVLIMLTVSALLYLGGRLLLGRHSGSLAAKGMTLRQPDTPSGAVRWLVTLFFAGVTVLAVMPHLALLLAAFARRWYGTVFPEGYTLRYFGDALSDPLVLPSIVNSLEYSALAMVIAVIAGFLTALIVERWKLKGGWLLDLLAMLPLAVPGIVMAFGFLGLADRLGGKYFDPVNNPLLLLAVAYAVRRLPYVVRAASSGLQQTPEELELAARNLGASAWRVLRCITVPLIAANLLVGMIFAFSFSMLEVSDSLVLAQKAEYFPITRAIYELSMVLGAGPALACAFGVWAMLFLGATLLAATLLLGKKIGAIFRL